MITIAMSTLVQAPRARVWRALVDPGEVVCWDARTLGMRGGAGGYPTEGLEVRWRYRVGSVPLELCDRPLEVVPLQRLRLARGFASLRYEETFSLGDEGSALHTRLSLRLAVSNSVPMLGGSLDRFDVRRFGSELVDESLRSLQKWCEKEP